MVSFDPPGNTQTATGHLYLPIIGTASCYVTVTNGGETLFDGWVTGECAAVGGPLAFGVYGGSDDPPPRDRYFKTTPWYLQYFGFDPRDETVQHPNGPGQPPQRGIVRVALTQPQGPNYATTYDWQLAGPIVVIEPADPNDLPASAQIKIGAIDGSGEGAIKPRVKYIFTWDGVTYGPFDDDSDQTPPPPAYADQGLNYYAFTAHKPEEVLANQEASIEDPTPIARDYEYPLFTHADGYHIWLWDNLGQKMPRVWVQERFYPEEFPPPPLNNNFYHNEEGQYWVTDGGLPTSLPPNEQEYLFNGWFGDYVGCKDYPVWVPFELNPNNPIYDLRHTYFAGTSTTQFIPSSAGGGIDMGTFRMKVWTNKTIHFNIGG